MLLEGKLHKDELLKSDRYFKIHCGKRVCLKSCLDFGVKKGNDVIKHLSRNNVAIAMDDAADPSFSYGMLQLRVYRRTSAKSCWKVCANVQPCRVNWPF